MGIFEILGYVILGAFGGVTIAYLLGVWLLSKDRP